ncbi:MAG: hypothetical protein JW751_23005 [Polyangiaceae bacterium]|nr:hypothetical protein [Polyangiaceae bacterium]
MTKTGHRSALRILVAGALIGGTARAEVFQSDAAQTPLPQPVSQAEIQLSDDLGWAADQQLWKDFEGNTLNPPAVYTDYFPDFVTGDAVRLSGLFKWRGEQLDEVADARTAPGYFSPACGFSGELVLRGGNCTLAFGWYNVDDPSSTTPPAPSEIYELIPANVETYMQCMTQNGQIQPEGTGFCPFGWDNHHPYNPPQLAWVPTAFDSGSIKEDPRYRGGLVAFALIGDPDSQCNQTKHSIAAHNDRNSSDEPWITALIWQSTVDPEGFYIGFEDLKMSPGDWHNPGAGAQGTNDGDFNDFVYFITGVSCEGGGEPCETHLLGACSLGRTDCVVDGSEPVCHPIIQPGAELCDNVDNDCNGLVDDGDDLCPAGRFCYEGNCVPSCSTGEFQCDLDRVCEQNVCVLPDCLGIECPPGQACREGACKDPCTDAVCPNPGEECQLGRCVDPCAAITCAAGRVCERGLCVSDCNCRPCAEGLECGADGRCKDPACANVVCDAGLVCHLGTCVDPCAVANCPGGAECIDGRCVDPVYVDQGSGEGGAPTITPGQTEVPGVDPPSGSEDGDDGSLVAPRSADPGCGCRVASAGGKDGWAGALLVGIALGGAWSRRWPRKPTKG